MPQGFTTYTLVWRHPSHVLRWHIGLHLLRVHHLNARGRSALVEALRGAAIYSLGAWRSIGRHSTHTTHLLGVLLHLAGHHGL